MSDVISNPSHYTEGRRYEPRKVIEDWDLDFYLGNALKYISRSGRKNDAIEDLKKAKQYLDFEIEKLEKAKPKSYRFGTFELSPTPISMGKIAANASDFNLYLDTKDEGWCPIMKVSVPAYLYDYALKDINTAIQRCKLLPDSRQKSISITKLEEARMWIEACKNDSSIRMDIEEDVKDD